MKKIKAVLLILSLIFFIGCWDRREPEDNISVIAIGFDYDVEEEKYKLITQIVSPIASHGGLGESGLEDKPQFWTVSSLGHTTLDALGNIRQKVSRYIHYSHTQIFVISEGFLEKKGILPVIDVLERSRDSRPIILLTVTKDDPEEILRKEMAVEGLSGKGIREMIELTDSEVGVTTVEHSRIFINKLSQPGIEAIAPMLNLYDENSNSDNENNEDDEEDIDVGMSPAFKLGGLAAFNKDRLVGFLEAREARGWNWIRGKINRAVLNLELPVNDNKLATIIINQSAVKVKPIIEEGEAKIKIEIGAAALLQGIMGTAEINKESQLTHSIKRRTAQVIRNDIKQAIEKAKELESDIFGFGNLFYRKENSFWQTVEDDWEKEFIDLAIEIEVEVEFKRAGMINQSINIPNLN